ncbi:MAG: glycosyltransferase family 2 protein, partial [Gammaproteobacteria bacterium]|nr:glycosyltransferase family 2 protein [Gammaproteobacteria bacterium]
MNQHLAGDNELSLSVIVPCYNSEQTLAETLEAIANQTCDQPWELIIADNLSTDNSASLAESFSKRFRHFRVITANDGQGTAFAINSGVREARGKSVIFCDSDDVPAAGWLAAMARALAEHEFVACKMDV